MGLAKVGLVNAVDLCELDVLVLQGGGGLFVVGSEGLAVTTPWRREGDKNVFCGILEAPKSVTCYILQEREHIRERLRRKCACQGQ